MLSADKTKYIEMTRSDLDTAKMLSTTEFLYKPSAAINLKSENDCIWRMLTENNIHTSEKICDYKPFPQGDILITLIDNKRYFLSSLNGTMVWEICEKGETQRFVQGENIITLNANCCVKTSEFIINPHRTLMFNQTKTINLNLISSKLTVEFLSNIA